MSPGTGEDHPGLSPSSAARLGRQRHPLPRTEVGSALCFQEGVLQPLLRLTGTQPPRGRNTHLCLQGHARHCSEGVRHHLVSLGFLHQNPSLKYSGKEDTEVSFSASGRLPAGLSHSGSRTAESGGARHGEWRAWGFIQLRCLLAVCPWASHLASQSVYNKE